MPFGINSEPEVWQGKMREHIEGLKGVEVIAYDFAIAGFGNTPAEWQTDHDRNVHALLDRLPREEPQVEQEESLTETARSLFHRTHSNPQGTETRSTQG